MFQAWDEDTTVVFYERVIKAQIGVALALIEGYPGGTRQSVCAKANRSELWILEDFDVAACVAGARLVCAVRA